MNEPKNEIVIYQPNETIRLDVRLENETVWLTQAQIANLFGTKRPAVTKHLTNIYKSGELDREGTCSILEHKGNDGRQSYLTTFYNLDAILSVGYRVNSRNATMFRRWATQVLKSYLLKGYALNARLNLLEDKMDRRFAKHDSEIVELKEKVEERKANIPEMLSAAKWDIVTIQQASHFSWDVKTFRPFADALIDNYIRRLAPQAKVVVQETWSYTPWDGRLAKWGFERCTPVSTAHTPSSPRPGN